MKPCINEATTMTTDFETDIKAYSKAGFEAVELWLDKVDRFIKENSLEEARKVLDENGISAVCGCAYGGIMLSEGEAREKAMAEFERKLGICQKLGASVLITVTDFPDKVSPESYDVAADNLREAGSIAEKYDVSLALEFIKGAKFLGCLATTIALVRKIDRKNVGIVIDIFHHYAGIGKIEDIEKLKAQELLFVHIDDAKDVPREILQDSDRVLLGEGVFPLERLIRAIEATGYDGYASLELFNRDLWDKDPYQVAQMAYENLTSYIGRSN